MRVQHFNSILPDTVLGLRKPGYKWKDQCHGNKEKNQAYILWALGMGNGDGEYFYCYGDAEVNILLHFNENNEVYDPGGEL